MRLAGLCMGNRVMQNAVAIETFASATAQTFKPIRLGKIILLRPIMSRIPLLALMLCLWLQGCASVPAPRESALQASLFEWQDEALELISKYQLNPLRASRVLAALHMTILSSWYASPGFA